MNSFVVVTDIGDGTEHTVETSPEEKEKRLINTLSESSKNYR